MALALQAVLRDTCAAGAHDQRRPRTQPRAFSLRSPSPMLMIVLVLMRRAAHVAL
jgi:hypothetical protein